MKFTTAQLNELRADYAKIERVSTENLPKFHQVLNCMTDDMLVQVAGAKVNFLSKLAVNECVRRNLTPARFLPNRCVRSS